MATTAVGLMVRATPAKIPAATIHRSPPFFEDEPLSMEKKKSKRTKASKPSTRTAQELRYNSGKVKTAVAAAIPALGSANSAAQP